MYEKELALNNLQWLIFHKTKPNQIPFAYPGNRLLRKTVKTKFLFAFLKIFEIVLSFVLFCFSSFFFALSLTPIFSSGVKYEDFSVMRKEHVIYFYSISIFITE